MDNDFELPVTYKGEELSFSGSLVTYGYSYRIAMQVFGQLVNFEPDEERNFRAVIAFEQIEEMNKVDKKLLEVIAAALRAAFE